MARISGDRHGGQVLCLEGQWAAQYQNAGSSSGWSPWNERFCSDNLGITYGTKKFGGLFAGLLTRSIHKAISLKDRGEY